MMYFYGKEKGLKVLIRFTALFIIIAASVVTSKNDIKAQKGNLNDSKYQSACEEAIMAVQPINEKKQDIVIGDLYNVIDKEGELEGYSLGYYVNDEPYGYAIYSLENKCVKEFVFESGVRNMYVELEEKAEELEEINNDEMIESVVYDGGIDYFLIDEEGNGVTTDAIYNDNSMQDELLEVVDNEQFEIDAIINSEFNVEVNSSSKKDTADIAGSYYGSEKNYWHMNCSGNDIFNCVPDYKLTMINQNYYIRNARKYCCEVSAGTGCLNWMGALVNSSLVDTYNYIWSYCGMNTELNRPEQYGMPAYAYYGLSDYDLARAMNSIFASKGLSTKAESVYRPKFSMFVDCIWRSNLSESYPAVLSIGGYSYTSGKEEYSGHALIAESYIKKKRTDTGYDNYIGVFQNWDGGEGNISDSNSTFELIRYLNYDNLMSEDNIEVGGVIFKDVSSRNIKETTTKYVSGNTIEIDCYVPYGTKYVFFPTWTVAGNGTDVVWHRGNIQYGTVASVSIDLNTYNKASGYYATDIYAYDGNMNQLACYGTVLNNINSNISNVKTSNKTIKGYKLTCNLPTGTARVAFPTWSSVNNQDDLIWYDGQIKNNSGNLQGEITIDVANHKNDGGLYITHIYAYDKYNKLIANDINGRADITDRKQITDAKITNVTSSSYKVSCKVPTGTSYVLFPTWTSYNASDDIIWYNAALSGDTAYLTINKSKHNNEMGVYNTHIYAFNSKGEILNSTTTSVTLK